ncbi:MAG: hypothetical protein IJ242_10880 [Clostridia bacterium]|nr:hypothetical protein [Clostridia bacterium]
MDDEQRTMKTTTSTIDDVVPEPSVKPAPQQEDTIGAYCSVSRLDNGKTETHWIDREVIKVGVVVEFLEEYQLVYGVVVLIQTKQSVLLLNCSNLRSAFSKANSSLEL